MSEIFEKPVEEVKAIEESDVIAEAPKPKEKKVTKQHISDERKAELKVIRVEALRKGREAKKAKREAEEAIKVKAQETKKEEEKPLLPIKETVEEKPKKEKTERKPRAYKSVNNSEVELMKKEKRIKELEYENETTFMKTELSKFQNENRLLKQKLESLSIKEEAPPVKEERKTSLKKKEPKRFNTRKNVFKI